jgi:RimJ/RimL family protein N-acetyltransferase
LPSITLRPPTASDAEQVYEAVRESLTDLVPWMTWCSLGYSLEDARSWAVETSGARVEGAAFSFLILDPSGRVLGVVGLNQINKEQRFANLGYWVRSSASGHGIAADAVRQLERWAFEETSLERLEIVIAVGNARSQRVAEKAGAVLEGVLRARLRIHEAYHDAFMYSLVRAATAKA